jgi:hypothetical protein
MGPNLTGPVSDETDVEVEKGGAAVAYLTLHYPVVDAGPEGGIDAAGDANDAATADAPSDAAPDQGDAAEPGEGGTD